MIQTRPATPDYRTGWDRVFGRRAVVVTKDGFVVDDQATVSVDERGRPNGVMCFAEQAEETNQDGRRSR